MRINKYLAEQNLCSRREADELIKSKKVYVNGTLAELGQQIGKGDVVELKRGFQKSYVYLAYHKPRGVITHSPKEGEEDIATNIGRNDVFPIGRLDKDSEGLILLTNDRRLTKVLLSPKSNVEKEYRVTVQKPLKKSVVKAIENGVDIEGYVTRKAKAKILRANQISITLTEGKKHQVRRMLAALGYTTEKLIRTTFAGITISNLNSGQLRELTVDEQKKLLSLAKIS